MTIMNKYTNSILLIIYLHLFAVDVGILAVKKSLLWQFGGKPAPKISKNGVVLFPYGLYQPIITCKPLNLCDISFQQGEHIQSVLIGDAQNWSDGDTNIPVVYSGVHNDAVPHIVLKPSQSGLETTLMVTTSVRSYMIKLRSASLHYLVKAGFDYSYKNHIVSNSKYKVHHKYFNYSWHPSFPWSPVSIFDNGISVFIVFTNSTHNLPLLCILDKENHCQIVNFTYRHHTYIVNQLFEHAKLVLNSQVIYLNRKILIIHNWHSLWSRLFSYEK